MSVLIETIRNGGVSEWNRFTRECVNDQQKGVIRISRSPKFGKENPPSVVRKPTPAIMMAAAFLAYFMLR